MMFKIGDRVWYYCEYNICQFVLMNKIYKIIDIDEAGYIDIAIGRSYYHNPKYFKLYKPETEIEYLDAFQRNFKEE